MKSILETYSTTGGAEDKVPWAELGGIAIFIVVVWTALWIWNLVAIIHFWNVLPVWAQVIGILGLVPSVGLGNIIALVVIYVAKKGKGGSSRRRRSSSRRRRSSSRRRR
jgi:hypothetical protein